MKTLRSLLWSVTLSASLMNIPALAAAPRCQQIFDRSSNSTGSLILKPGLRKELEERSQYLTLKYDLNQHEKVEYTPNKKYPTIVRMSGPETLAPLIPANTVPVRESKEYDVVIAGAGPAGLTHALNLAEQGFSVLILERNEKAGGLGMGSVLNGVSVGGGAAYSTGPDGGLAYKIFQKIGLGAYKKKLAIPEPIDSYVWNGKLYKGIWEEHTLKELPPSFALFKHALLRLAKKGANLTEGPMAEWADKIDMATMTRMMPKMVAEWTDAKSKEILRDYQERASMLPATDPMSDVIALLDLYGRSALGRPAKDLSARQHMDFYESELTTRYTGVLGTGTVTEAILKSINKYPDLITVKTLSPVASVENLKDGALVNYIENGILKSVKAKVATMSLAITLAPKLIKNLFQMDPEKVETIKKIEMADYAVHVVRTKGRPWKNVTYDLWVHNDGNMSKLTDIIDGNWMLDRNEPGRQSDEGIYVLYNPLAGQANPANFEHGKTLQRVEQQVDEMISKLSPLVEKPEDFEPVLIETYRWPFSIHVVAPGFLEKKPILQRPVGNIHFANNTTAAPELETAMEAAWREADKIAEKLKSSQPGKTSELRKKSPKRAAGF